MSYAYRSTPKRSVLGPVLIGVGVVVLIVAVILSFTVFRKRPEGAGEDAAKEMTTSSWISMVVGCLLCMVLAGFGASRMRRPY